MKSMYSVTIGLRLLKIRPIILSCKWLKHNADWTLYFAACLLYMCEHWLVRNKILRARRENHDEGEDMVSLAFVLPLPSPPPSLYLAELRFEFRASHWQMQHSTAWVTPPSPRLWCVFFASVCSLPNSSGSDFSPTSKWINPVLPKENVVPSSEAVHCYCSEAPSTTFLISRLITSLKYEQAPQGEVSSATHEEVYSIPKGQLCFSNLCRQKSKECMCKWIVGCRIMEGR
jgi:hypothetical protein